MKKILFVTAPYHCWGVQVVGTWPPLHLTYLAGAALQAGAEARIFDAMNKKLGFAEIREEIERYRPDFVMAIDYLPVTGAISTATVPDVIRILNLAKEVDPAIVTLTGGPHPTFMFHEMLGDPANQIDYVLRGEPEAILMALLQAPTPEARAAVAGLAFRRGSETVVTPRQPHIEALDTLEPAWHLLDWEDYHYLVEPQGRMASILSSRGCDMGCAFCSQRMFWEKDWRSREPEAVVAEMRHLIEAHQVEYFTLIDAYPTKNRRRWEHYLDLLIEAELGVRLLIETRVEDIIRDEDILEKYARAGIVHVYIGAESAEDEVLSVLNKGTAFEQNKRALDLLREHEIMTEASFMIGFPTETWESIERTIESAIYLNPDVAVFPVVTPMPFTPIYAEMKDRIRVWDYSKYNLVTPIIEPEAMSLEEVTKALGRCYMKFYRHKMKEVLALPKGYKRTYMLSAFKLMMKTYGESFDFVGGGLGMPHPLP
ncbi:MAG: radical SAM protein [Deltaproteobacteria bacterium]|nr:radical SAM protein [Deltaproteobacteria bacterium]